MGRSSSSYGKKTDKETQSPMLKIFREIMQKEQHHNKNNKDLEKATLVKEKPRKKRKQYSSSQSKTKSVEHRSVESSAAERPPGYNHPQHITQQVIDTEKVFSAARSASINKFPSEKRESWWLWGDANLPNHSHGCNPTCRGKRTSTTRSCVSCQLKKILSNEYACIGCLIFLFTISVLVAFMLVFKTLALPETQLSKKEPNVKETTIPDSKAMYDKLKKFEDYPRTTEDYRRLDFSRDIRRSVWGDVLASNSDGSGLPELDFSESSFQNADHLVGAGNAQSYEANDLARILDPKKFDDEKISPKMKKFYRKLLETDAQIKNLKKGLYENPSVVVTGNKSYRLKRSLFRIHKKTTKRNTKPETTTQSSTTKTTTSIPKEVEEINKETTTERKIISTTKQNAKQNTLAKITSLFHFKHKNKNNDHKNRLRRFENGTEMPAGFVFRQKELIVQYRDKNPKFPKCSHTKELIVQPLDNTIKLKYPDRRDSEKLDELLGQFMDKTLHKTTLDLYGLEALLSKKKTPEYKYKMTTPSTRTSTLSMKQNTVPTGYVMKTFMPTLYAVLDDEESLYRKYLKPNVAKAKQLKTELKKYLKQTNLPKRDHSLKSVMVHNNGDIDFERTTRNYDVALSIATLINPSDELLDYQERDKHRSSVMKDDTLFESDKIISKIPVRKLLLTEDEEENQEDELIGYEDLKEVLSDDMATHDENERQVEKRKRSDDSKETKLEDVLPNPVKYIPPPGVYNPNWKGAVPLYPDELNSMMKHPIDTSNPTPPTVLHMSSPIQMSSPVATNLKLNDGDMQYVETYLSNKYQKVANLAQAYSDYGVLKGMNENSKNIKTQDKTDRKMMTTTEKMDRFKRSSEGLSVQIKPYSNAPSDDDPSEFMRTVSKHIRFGKPFTRDKLPQDHTTLIPLTPDFDVIYNPHHYKVKKPPPKEYDYSYSFRKLRSLESANFESTYDEVTQVDPIFITLHNNGQPTTSVSSSITSPFVNILNNDVSTESLKLKNFLNNKTKRSALDVDSLKKETKDKRGMKLENITDTGNITKDGLQRETDAKAVTREIRHDVKEATIKQSNKTKNNEMGVGDFFALMSDWFSKLSNLSEANVTGNLNLNSKPSDFVNITSANKAKDLAYPMYDSDMIDNIGHRSRVILSMEEDHANLSEKADGENVSDNSADISNSTEATSVNFTGTINGTKRDVNAQSDSLEKDSKVADNKTVAKRSAPDSLLFWDDIYDDEYGIQLDQLDESKSETKAIDSSRKSSGWLQNKMRKMTDSIKKRSKDSFNKIYRPSKKYNGNIDDIGNNLDDVLHNIVKRDDLSNTENDNFEKKRKFAFLTAQMKDVCQQASQAVQQTRSIRPRQDHESDMASGLMQQLVKLMSDLVDFEVEQRTCLKLPADLKGFLEWLTNPPKLQPHKNVQIFAGEKGYSIYPSEGPIDIATTQSSEKEEGKTDARSECLGTLHAVENLMQEYTQLSDDDKNKMSGVKEYLEDQMDFLNKQISSIEETTNLASMYLKNVVPFRYRRDVNNLKDVDFKRMRQRNNFLNGRRAKRKFLKSYYTKHTSTTSSNFESLLVSKVLKQKDAETNHNTDEENSNGIHIQELTKDAEQNHANFDHNNGEVNIDPPTDEKTKRNLQDVYYKAVADAKKMTTDKAMRTKEFESFKDPGVRMKA